jgi:hypothetical protein
VAKRSKSRRVVSMPWSLAVSRKITASVMPSILAWVRIGIPRVRSKASADSSRPTPRVAVSV